MYLLKLNNLEQMSSQSQTKLRVYKVYWPVTFIGYILRGSFIFEERSQRWKKEAFNGLLDIL